MSEAEKNNISVVKLTPDFTLAEFIRQDTPMPPPWILDNLHRLAHRLQVVRDIFDAPVMINSGYRSRRYNEKIGGAVNSYHMSGMAADIVIQGISASEVQMRLKNWSGGLGSYDSFTHLDIRPHKARWRG